MSTNTESTLQELAQNIEGILFWKGEAVSKKKLIEMFECSEGQLEEVLKHIDNETKNRGISLVQTDSEVELRTSKTVSKTIDQIQKDELSRDLGKASLETLAIVCYRGPSTRKEIEYVRGVNCQSILRTLEIRGLIEREEEGSRILYKPSIDLLGHLGIATLQELPEIDKVKGMIEKHEENTEE